MNSADSEHWLALLHQLPAKPPYLRVKIWRRLQAIAAVPLQNAVHVLPRREGAEAAFHELLAEITSSGGAAVQIDAQMIADQSDAELRSLLDAARNPGYHALTQAPPPLLDTGPPSPQNARMDKRG